MKTHHGKLGIEGWTCDKFELRRACAGHATGNGGGKLVRGAAVAGYDQGAEITKEVWARWDGEIMSVNQQKTACHQTIHVNLRRDEREKMGRDTYKL